MLELIESLDIPTFNEIVDSLNENDRWNVLADTLKSYSVEFKNVELQKWRRSESPSSKLLQELMIRCCTINVFKLMLQEANLLETLSIIADPEPLNIFEQPTGDVDCRLHPGEKCQHIHKHTELVLKCRATGMPPPKYQWHRDNLTLEGCTGFELRIDKFTFEHEGEYWCLVSHITRGVTKETKETKSDGVICNVMRTLPQIAICVITEQGSPFFPTAPVIVKEGKDLRIAVTVKCDPPYTLQWHKDNVVLNGQTSPILQITKATTEQSGKYFCSASNEAGTSISALLVKVEPPRIQPCIYPHPRPTRKVALLIGNSTYDKYEDLKTSSNDILLLADHLKRVVDFEVIALENLSLKEMHRAMEGFFELLSPGSYAVFCFVGHGFHYNKRDYMMPVDCNRADDKQLLDSASGICDDILEQKAIKSGLGLFVLIADMCRMKQRCSIKADENENPEDQDTDSTSRPHIMRLYSASENQSAYEVKGRRNGVYIPNLCKYIFEDKPIYDAVGDANRSFLNDPLAKKQTPAMKAQGINSMKLTDAAVEKVGIILQSYQILKPFPLYINPHCGFICNALDVTFSEPQTQNRQIIIDCELPKELTFHELTAKNGTRGITIYNIQRAKLQDGVFHVNLCLSDETTTEPKRLCLKLNGTLVGPAKDKIFLQV